MFGENSRQQQMRNQQYYHEHEMMIRRQQMDQMHAHQMNEYQYVNFMDRISCSMRMNSMGRNYGDYHGQNQPVGPPYRGYPQQHSANGYDHLYH